MIQFNKEMSYRSDYDFDHPCIVEMIKMGKQFTPLVIQDLRSSYNYNREFFDHNKKLTWKKVHNCGYLGHVGFHILNQLPL